MALIKPTLGTTLNTAHALSQGLVARLVLNEGSGTTIWDSSGYARDGLLKNAAAVPTGTSGWLSDSTGVGIRLDGINDCLGIVENSSLSPSFITVAVYVRFNSLTNNFSEAYNCLWAKEQTTSPYGSALLVKSNGKLAVFLRDTAATDISYDGTGAITLATGVDYFIVMTFSATELVVYVNGAVDKTLSNAAGRGLAVISAETRFSSSAYGSGRYFNGAIYDAIIYNRALSAGEVATLTATPYVMFNANVTLGYPISETFANGIPAGFADTTIGNSAVALTVTYNAAQQAVDLVTGVADRGWNIASANRSDDFWFEADLELIADALGTRYIGLWLQDSTFATPYYSAGYYIWHNSTSWGADQINNNKVAEFTGARYINQASLFNIGDRKTVRIDWKITERIPGVVSVNGIVVGFVYFNGRSSLRPGVYLDNCSVRVHSVAGNIGAVNTYSSLVAASSSATNLSALYTAFKFNGETTVKETMLPNNYSAFVLGGDTNSHTIAGATGYSNSYASFLLGGANTGRSGKVRGEGLNSTLPRKDTLFSGSGLISGTVTCTGVPSSRKVRLFDKQTARLVREVWSDDSGYYEFKDMILTKDYLVVSHDYTRVYNAVADDKVAL